MPPGQCYSTPLMRSLDPELLSALSLIQKDDLARKVFAVVAERPGVSGWALARQLNTDPKKMEEALASLTTNRVLQTTCDGGLQGNYALTDLGFNVKDQLKSTR